MIRQHFIEASLAWRGEVSRRDLVAKFRVSNSRASLDIQTYLRECERQGLSNMEFDARRKFYRICGATFAEIYPPTTQAEARELGVLLELETVRIPHPPHTQAAQALHRACVGKFFVAVEYFSSTLPESETLMIQPHHLVDDGNRLHVRAYCLPMKAYRDLVVGRIQILNPRVPMDLSLPLDAEWDEMVSITLAPHSDIDAAHAHQEASGLDRGMTDGKLKITTRQALLPHIRIKAELSDHPVRYFKEVSCDCDG